MMLRLIKNLLGILILVFLIWYLSTHWGELKPLLDLTAGKLAVVYGVSLAGTLIAGMTNKLLLRALGAKTKFWDMVFLQNAVYLLNYVPMKFGTLFRANYLKRHYNLSYARFGSFFMYLTLIMTFTTPLIGVVILLTVYGVDSWEAHILLTDFVVSFVMSIVLLFVPVPLPKGQNRISGILRGFLEGRNSIIQNKKTLLYCALLMNINFVLSSVRLGIIYSTLGQDVHPAGFLILGAAGYLLMFVSITPGSIGIREVVLGATAVVLGVPFKIGIPAALLDRAVAVSYSFVIGGVCAIWLWRKSPKDFAKIRESQMA